MPRRNNSAEGFHNVIQNSFTNIHFSVLKVIPLLMKEDILGEKKKSVIPSKEMDQQAKRKV